MSIVRALSPKNIFKCILVVGVFYALLFFLTIRFNDKHESVALEYTFPIQVVNVYYPGPGTHLFGTMGMKNEVVDIALYVFFDFVIIFLQQCFYQALKAQHGQMPFVHQCLPVFFES
ncbi:hypothetical protein ACFL20_12980, partial [Spirochaetota bacterium]